MTVRKFATMAWTGFEKFEISVEKSGEIFYECIWRRKKFLESKKKI